MIRHILIILALGISTACGSNSNEDERPAPTPTPESQAHQVAEEEDGFQRRFRDGDRVEARQAAADYLKQKLPTWTVKGIASSEYQAGIYWVDVDVTKRERSVVVSLAVRKFFPESGEPYWKAVSLDKTLAQQLHDLNDADLFNRLNDALEENKELESQILDEPEPEEPPDRR